VCGMTGAGAARAKIARAFCGGQGRPPHWRKANAIHILSQMDPGASRERPRNPGIHRVADSALNDIRIGNESRDSKRGMVREKPAHDLAA